MPIDEIFEAGFSAVYSGKPKKKLSLDEISKNNDKVFDEIDTAFKEADKTHIKYFDKLLKHKELFAVLCGYRPDSNLEDTKMVSKIKSVWNLSGNAIISSRIGDERTPKEQIFANLFYYISNFAGINREVESRIKLMSEDLFDIIQESSKGKEKLKELMGKGGKSTVCEDYLKQPVSRGGFGSVVMMDDSTGRTTARNLSRAERDFGIARRWEGVEISDFGMPI